MPTRKEISKIKADFIFKREKLIRGKLSAHQLNLLDILLNKYLENIAGKKLTSSEELKVINSIEKAIKTFSNEVNTSILKEYSKSALSLGDLNMSYYATMFDDVEKLDLIKQKANLVLNKKLGLLEDGAIKPKGFIDKMITDKSIQKKIVKQVRVSITNGYGIQELRESFKKIITGSDESAGIFERHYNTFAKDILNSIDNLTGKIYADELGLKHAYYAGGLIKTSRSICIKNNGKIFSTEQIEALREDPFIKNMYGANISDYDPFEQPGGHGCLHSWDWITEDLAKGNTREQNKKASERNEAFKKKNKL